MQAYYSRASPPFPLSPFDPPHPIGGNEKDSGVEEGR
jgi:hypothetical protein